MPRRRQAARPYRIERDKNEPAPTWAKAQERAATLTDEQLAEEADRDVPGWQGFGMGCAAEDEIARRRRNAKA